MREFLLILAIPVFVIALASDLSKDKYPNHKLEKVDGVVVLTLKDKK